jgi:hypothetical protein
MPPLLNYFKNTAKIALDKFVAGQGDEDKAEAAIKDALNAMQEFADMDTDALLKALADDTKASAAKDVINALIAADPGKTNTKDEQSQKSESPSEKPLDRALPDPNAWISGTLAFVVTIGFLVVVGIAYWHVVPNENAGLLNVLLGALGTAFITIVNFYFGSSLGSKTKDIANLALLKSSVEKSQE